MKRKKETETWVHNHPNIIKEFVTMPVSVIVELLDLLKIREYAQVFPTVSFQDALTELFPAMGKRVEKNPAELGLTKAEAKKLKAEVIRERERAKVKAKELELEAQHEANLKSKGGEQ